MGLIDLNGEYLENGFDQHWKVVNSGARVLSNTPQQLWESAIEYFKWCDDNPVKAKRTLTSGKTSGEKVELEFVRPYSIKGFCLHCNVSMRYLNDLKDSKDRNSEWYMVVEKIMMIVYTQNLEGAMVDLYNPIITSKLLNLDSEKENEGTHVKVEIVDSRSSHLANSENELLKKLDLEKLEILDRKAEILTGKSTDGKKGESDEPNGMSF